MLFFLGTTLSYVAPEIFCGVGTKTNKCSDIYSLGISMFEILSNLDSPWENVVSFPSDCMIKDAVEKGLRPDLDSFDLIYDKETCILHGRMIPYRDQTAKRYVLHFPVFRVCYFTTCIAL